MCEMMEGKTYMYKGFFKRFIDVLLSSVGFIVLDFLMICPRDSY